MTETDTINFNIGRITALKTLRDKTLALAQAMEELGKPIIEDYALLPRIYDIYRDVFARRGKPKQALQVYHRKKFIFVVLYLYSPRTLAGDRMRFGLRDKLSELFGLATSTPVSDNCANLMFCYNSYRDFRRDVSVIFNEVMSNLGDELVVPD